MNRGMILAWNASTRMRRYYSGHKSRHDRRLAVENLERRQMLAADMTALAGDLGTSPVPPPQDAAVTTVSVVEDSVPPIVRNRGRASADSGDGAQERPGEGWEASAADVEADILSPLAIDNAVAVDNGDPPETRSRARISDEVDDSDGAHKRPGRGWD